MSNRRLVPLNVVSLPTAPTGTSRPGDIYHNSTDGNLYVSDGSVWVSLGGADGPYNSSDFAADFSARTTDDLAEGTNRLYFTVQRARSATAGVYDPAGAASAAQTAAESYTDTRLSTFTGLPDQSGFANYFLGTDGTTASWKSVPGVGNLDGGFPSTNFTSVAPVDGGSISWPS